MKPGSQVNCLTDVCYWQTSRPKCQVTPAVDPYTFEPFLERFIPPNPDGTALEIGAVPGHYLAALSLGLGYQPVALDFVPEVQELPAAFRRVGIPNLRAIQQDFLKWHPEERFDVVTSFGFIEHFRDWQPILSRHWELVKPGGWLAVGVPVFGPMQMLLRRLVYTPEKLALALQSHNLEATSLRNLRAASRQLPRVQIVFASHIWHMKTWIQTTDPGVRSSSSGILKLWRTVAKLPAALQWSCRFFSPEALIILRKQSPAGEG